MLPFVLVLVRSRVCVLKVLEFRAEGVVKITSINGAYLRGVQGLLTRTKFEFRLAAPSSECTKVHFNPKWEAFLEVQKAPVGSHTIVNVTKYLLVENILAE